MSRPRRTGWKMHFGDFANMLKAFVGSSYLGVSYAFSQSGLLLGIIGVIIIASLTDHCCHLIVKVKYYAMKQILAEQKEKRRISKSYETRGNRLDYSSFDANGHLQGGREQNTAAMDESVELEEIKTLEQHMLKHMSYGDIGRLSYGTVGLVLVNIFIAITQFCFCVGYFIFIGNTIHRLFPINGCVNMTIITEIPTPISIRTTPSTFSLNDDSKLRESFTGLDKSLDTVVDSIATVTDIPYLRNTTDSNVTVPWMTVDPSYNLTTVFPDSNVTVTNSSASCIEKSTAPSLKYFVASPIPIFLIFALIRSIRKMSWISATANFSILGGCLAILVYLVVGFQINPRFHWVNVEGVAIFFGIVTAGFEGIGLVIPVEASMEGNRHNFGKFLHGVIAILSVILATFGILGYLEFADGVQQMVNLNIQHGSISFYIVNVGVCFGVLLTFPLQIYPVIELIELILFSEGRIFGPKPLKSLAIANDDAESSQSLLEDITDDLPVCVAAHIPDSVAAWKRNIVRIVVVLVAAGLAIVFRNNFAYIGAFTGAVGSSALMYFLPCLFHIKLCRQDISILVVIKNILIMIFGVVASIISLYYVVLKLVHNTNV